MIGSQRVIEYVRQFPASLWVLSLGWFVSAMGFGVSVPFIAIYFHAELGLSMIQIGIFFGVMAVIRSGFQIIGGEIADRIERRSLLIHTQIIRALIFFLLAAAIYGNWGFLAVAGFLIITSIFGALFQPAANAMVADILPESLRMDGYAVTRSAINLGWAVGPALGGFLAVYSYGLLFIISGLITLVSGLVVLLFLSPPPQEYAPENFKLSDVIAVKDDPNMAWHVILIFVLYLVHSQLIAPFSVYAVEMVRISEHQLGLLYTLNGLLVVSVQVPVTRLLSRSRLTTQMAFGGLVYTLGYALIGLCAGFSEFVLAVVVVTAAEVIVSPPSLALAARLAPDGRTGRYMGIFGFFVAAGWSFGPLYGGFILDHFGDRPGLAWVLIGAMALVPAMGYLLFSRRLPAEYNAGETRSG